MSFTRIIVIIREEQSDALGALLKKNCGVLSAATAFGKTVVGAALVAKRKINTLILVHRSNLLKQWRDQLEKFLIINEAPPVEYTPKGRKRKKSVIGQFSGVKHDLRGIVDVAVMQSLISDNEVNDIVKNYGMIIVDECHHVSAFSFEKILKEVNAKYVYGLTATPVRQDGHQPIIFMQCGNIAYKADNRKRSEQQSFEHYMLPRFTPFRHIDSRLSEIYADMVKDELRNDMIVDDCKLVLAEGRTPIILTERTRHVDILAEKLNGYSVIKLVGGMSRRKNDETIGKLNSVSQDEKIVIIATGKYVGEGFDFPRLDTLFLAMPISWKGTLAQYAGRLHRDYENKKEVRIYDYIDISVPMLERMYQKRLIGYSSIGYRTRCENELEKSVSRIFDSSNFLEMFITDVSSASREVFIVSPFVSKRTVYRLLPFFDSITGNKTILTRPAEDYSNDINRSRVVSCFKTLEDAGFMLMFKSKIHQKFAVIDKRIIWYGSINLLSYDSSEESIMRLESTGIAEELLDSL